MSFRAIIFDLDGTLIDSQKSILNAIRSALNELGLEAKIPLTKDLIGPPLMGVLSKITAIKDTAILYKIADKFRFLYDYSGYKDSIKYPGIDDLLNSFKHQGYIMYIATNKRTVPTKKILEHITWNHFFSEIYCIDSRPSGPFKSKCEMISVLLEDQGINLKSAIYVGDTLEDYEAARSNDLQCILVDWGYGSFQDHGNSDYCHVENSTELFNLIQEVL